MFRLIPTLPGPVELRLPRLDDHGTWIVDHLHRPPGRPAPDPPPARVGGAVAVRDCFWITRLL